MFQIGDIVRPKKGYYGDRYKFRIIEISKLRISDKSEYKLEIIAEKLNPKFGPFNEQINEIKKVENSTWVESELISINENNIFRQPKALSDELLQTKNNKEENKMEKILRNYYERKEEQIDKEYDKKIIEIQENDEIQQLVKEFNEKVNTILANDNTIIMEYNVYTNETSNKEKELLNEKELAIKELQNTIKDIDALFELTNDFKEKTRILENYGIIDKKGKIVI